jgi:hypothetical protein
MNNLESALAMIAIVLFFYVLIGSLVLALFQKLGFRFVVGLPKEERPSFFKLYLVQILTSLIIALIAYLTFKTGLFLNPSFMKFYFTAFGISAAGIIASISAQFLFQLSIYVVIAAWLTTLLAKKGFVDSLKSQLITIVLLLIIWAAGLTVGSKYLLEQVNILNLTSTEQSVGNESSSSGNSPLASESEKSHYSKALDEYEKMIISFEGASKKEPLCQSDMMNLTLEMIPQLTAMNAEFQQMQGTGNDIKPEDLTKYMNLLNRFNKATMNMNNKVADPTC